MMNEEASIINTTDHDLLIEIRADIRSVRSEVTSIRQAHLDHETRLRLNEASIEQMKGTITGLKWVAGVIGFISVIIESIYYLIGFKR